MTFEVHTNHAALNRAVTAGINAMHSRMVSTLEDRADEISAMADEDAVETILDIWRLNGLEDDGPDARRIAEAVLEVLREPDSSSEELEN